MHVSEKTQKAVIWGKKKIPSWEKKSHGTNDTSVMKNSFKLVKFHGNKLRIIYFFTERPSGN